LRNRREMTGGARSPDHRHVERYLMGNPKEEVELRLFALIEKRKKQRRGGEKGESRSETRDVDLTSTKDS